MGMTLRRYHAARKERFDKQEALQEAKANSIIKRNDDYEVPFVSGDSKDTVVEKRKYVKRTVE